LLANLAFNNSLKWLNMSKMMEYYALFADLESPVSPSKISSQRKSRMQTACNSASVRIHLKALYRKNHDDVLRVQ